MALAKQGFPISDIRGRGLMVAMEFGGKDGGLAAEPGTASAVTKAAGKRNMLLLTAGGPPFAVCVASPQAQAYAFAFRKSYHLPLKLSLFVFAVPFEPLLTRHCCPKALSDMPSGHC